jgi:hypothetical protein
MYMAKNANIHTAMKLMNIHTSATIIMKATATKVTNIHTNATTNINHNKNPSK